MGEKQDSWAQLSFSAPEMTEQWHREHWVSQGRGSEKTEEGLAQRSL